MVLPQLAVVVCTDSYLNSLDVVVTLDLQVLESYFCLECLLLKNDYPFS